MPGYRCACEPAAVERSAVRATPRLFATRHLWRRRDARLAAVGIAWRLLPGLSHFTVRTAVLRRWSATVWANATDARAAPQKPAAVHSACHDHCCPCRTGWTGHHWPELRTSGDGVPERRLSSPAAGQQSAADTSTADVRRSRSVDHQECVLSRDRAYTGPLQ